MSNERRSSPRIELLDRLHGHIASLGTSVRVREMSLGGMSIETPFELPEGDLHEFRLTLGDDSTVLLRGRVTRCRLVQTAEGVASYISGVQFIDEEQPDTSVGDLIDKIK